MGPGNLEGAEGSAEGSFVKAASLHLHGSPGGPPGDSPGHVRSAEAGHEAPRVMPPASRCSNREAETGNVGQHQ